MFSKMYIIFDKIRTLAVISLLSFIVILCFMQVVLRYFTPADLTPFAWGDEIMRLTSIWVVFLASSCGARKGAHMTVDFFIDRYFKARAKFIIKKLTLLLVLIILAAIAFYGATYTFSMRNSMLQNVNMSMAWFYSAIPIGIGFLFIEFLLLFLGIDPQSKKR
ncbi:MAG: TRAP transporter small permease subunit [Succinatimonas sp.]|nr:TRAP transporter small permease subunit [Succinatimonas sp.]